MHATIALGAILAVAPAVSAIGSAIVENRCDFPVYLWSVSDTDGQMYTVDANNGNYSETYRTNSNGGGVSIKIARDQAQTSITQFEYTLDNSLWYDISNINGYPFEDWGVTLSPDESGCRNILCQAGVAACADAYNVPSDNQATSMCSTNTNTVMVLCSDQQSSTDASDSVNDASDSVNDAAQNVGSVLNLDNVIAAPQTTPPPAAPVASTPDNSNNDVTTFTTEVVTVAAAAPTQEAAPSQDTSESASYQWFGHHEAGWVPGKARRHVHHPHAAHE